MSLADDVHVCACAMIRRHGAEAALVAQNFAEAHDAVAEHETARFWAAIAAGVRRILGPPR